MHYCAIFVWCPGGKKSTEKDIPGIQFYNKKTEYVVRRVEMLFVSRVVRSTGVHLSRSSSSDHGKHVGLLSDKILSSEARRTYRRLFRQAKAMKKYDVICGSYVEWRARNMFRRNQYETSPKKRKAELKASRKHARLLGKANSGNSQALEKVIAYSYGQRGRVKHLLQYRINDIIVSGGHKTRQLLPRAANKDTNSTLNTLETLPAEMLPLLRYCEDEAWRRVRSRDEQESELESGVGAGKGAGAEEREREQEQEERVRQKLTVISKWDFAKQHLEATSKDEVSRRRRRLYEKALLITQSGELDKEVSSRRKHSRKINIPSMCGTVDEFFSTQKH